MHYVIIDSLSSSFFLILNLFFPYRTWGAGGCLSLQITHTGMEPMILFPKCWD